MSAGALFALGATICGFMFVIDVLVTRIGVAHGLAEANPIYKILPQKLRDFLMTAFGGFLDAGLKLIGTGVVASLLYNHAGMGQEYGSKLDSLIFWIPAAGLLVLTIRNYSLIRKAPK